MHKFQILPPGASIHTLIYHSALASVKLLSHPGCLEMSQCSVIYMFLHTRCMYHWNLSTLLVYDEKYLQLSLSSISREPDSNAF